MPEYMDYNDSPEQTKGQKIRNIIGLTLSAVFIIVVVMWVFIFAPKNTRSDFDAVTSKIHTAAENIGGENEFLKFSEYLNKNEGKNLQPDSQMQNSFPQVYSLMSISKSELVKNEVLTFDKNGCFTLAKVYLLEQSENDKNTETADSVHGTMGIDFICLKYNFENGGFCVASPVRYSIRYYCGSDIVVPYYQLQYVKREDFKLNFYSLTVNISGKSDFVDCKVKLNDAINKDEAENEKWQKKISLNGFDKLSYKTTDGGTRSDKFVAMRFNPENAENVGVKLAFDDVVYNKLSAFGVFNKNENAQYSITVN